MDAIDSDEFEGGLLHLLSESTAFIRRNMRVMWRKLSNTREDYPDYQERAYFEALVNGLILLTIPNLNYQNDKIKAILEENDREQVGDQVRVQDRVQVRDQVKEQVREQVVGQVTVGDIIDYCKLPRTRAEIQDYCGLVSRRSFNENHLKPMLEAGILKMTIPDKPNSKNQRYYSEYET